MNTKDHDRHAEYTRRLKFWSERAAYLSDQRIAYILTAQPLREKLKQLDAKIADAETDMRQTLARAEICQHVLHRLQRGDQFDDETSTNRERRVTDET